MESKNRNLWIIVIVVAVLVVACCAVAAITMAAGWFVTRSVNLEPADLGGHSTDRLEQSFSVGDAPELDIDNFAGSIRIRPGPAGTVHVVAVKNGPNRSRLDGIQVSVSEQGGGVKIKTRSPSTPGNVSVDLEITAPADARLDVNNGAGSINTRGIIGPININSGAGEVDIREARGPVDVDLGAGQIIYQGAPSGDCHFGTGAGEISLRLPSDLNMEVDLSTGIGAVDVEFPVHGQVKVRKVQGVIGDGSDGSITARTGAGSIKLRQQ